MTGSAKTWMKPQTGSIALSGRLWVMWLGTPWGGGSGSRSTSVCARSITVASLAHEMPDVLLGVGS
ncbi:hypothetical protein PF005_g5615 [Phytophthora fragariae]|uniref:Uncharacterized protein n=1 Tax=Phytophthora fragariae TaxID=53985 RepID=A0A6A3EZC5_9STRA|nr:hypothetical protein PF003_g30706 [Phytophthora fragariae]KAE8938904.1 hypothetical protein PF009_g11252 [Phytophthora fragariae]KAE9126221.1 hypothetical protein PF007_g6067 [Phytophthora fragariae]KAE9128415.1 hypothetical protein PF006_g16281 [Phytophthora fragariae]KAE9221776.1 hypothetical protein PF002_g15468 [Phytophthora fragariae]